jgi:hypothetical protein
MENKSESFMHTLHGIDDQNGGLQGEKARLYQSFTLRSIAINAGLQKCCQPSNFD